MSLFNIAEVNYSNRHRNLNVEATSKVKSTKFFPVYIDGEGTEVIFKPLSNTKPMSTPFFAYSEVYWSYIIKKYFDPKAPQYQLAFCRGITETEPKYQERGTLVPSIIKQGQELVNFFDYYRNNPDRQVNIKDYKNYCMEFYSYIPFFKSQLFATNTILSEQLALQVLLSMLSRNQNFHYENLSLICEKDKVLSVAPPIDHEFSSMFIYLDDKIEYKTMHRRYDANMTGELKSKIEGFFPKLNEDARQEMFLLYRDIGFIAKGYPNVVTKFLEGIEQMKDDLKKSPIQLEDSKGYIVPFSTDDWEIGHARIKKGNEACARQLEEDIVPKRVEVNLAQISDELNSDTIHSIDILQQILGKYINKGQSSDKEVWDN